MSKFCIRCGTENKDDYSFCKRCGAMLEGNTQTYEPPKKQYVFEEFDGVKTEDLEIFIGPNSEKIINKWNRMRLADSKISWCWPVAILGYFFGIFGAAFWFLYRKMYKVAFFCIAVGVALSVCRGVLISSGDVANKYKDFVTNNAQSVVSSADSAAALESFQAELEKFTEDLAALPEMRALSIINTAEKWGSAILFGIFAIGIYKKHAVKKIKKYSENNIASPHYGYGIQKIGGTSGGMAFLGVVISVFASFVPGVLVVASLL